MITVQQREKESVKIDVRATPSLKAALKKEASKLKVSLSAYIKAIISNRGVKNEKE